MNRQEWLQEGLRNGVRAVLAALRAAWGLGALMERARAADNSWLPAAFQPSLQTMGKKNRGN
jgi:hypothetical protein